MSRNSATSLFPQIVRVLYMEQIGPLPFRQLPECVRPFCLASWLLAHQGEGLAELEASGSTSVCHSFWKADNSNELVPDKVSAFVRSLVTSQHPTLPLISPALSFSSETERKEGEIAKQVQKWVRQRDRLMTCWSLKLSQTLSGFHGDAWESVSTIKVAFCLDITLFPGSKRSQVSSSSPLSLGSRSQSPTLKWRRSFEEAWPAPDLTLLGCETLGGGYGNIIGCHLLLLPCFHGNRTWLVHGKRPCHCFCICS